MPVKRKRYVKIMENVWITYDKRMTSLMAFMCGQVLMAFMNGELRMASYLWSSTCGYLRMALIKECYRC